MKKIISLALCLVIISLCFSGCTGPNSDLTEDNITQTIETVETALKEFNTKKLRKYVSSSTLSTIIGYAENKEQFTDLGKAIFENLTIEISEIDLEKQSVTVNVINKDLYKTANSFATNLKEQYSPIILFSKLNDDYFLNENLEILCNQISRDEMMDEEITVTLKIKQEKKNLVVVFDEIAENAVSGYSLSAIKSIYK